MTRSRDKLTTACHKGIDAPARYPTITTCTPVGRPTGRHKDAIPLPHARDAHHARDRCHHASHRGRSCAARPLTQGPTSGLALVFPPPPQPLVDSHGGKLLHVERILIHRDVKGQRMRYLDRRCGYPSTHDSWAPRAQMMMDVEGLVHKNDETHPTAKKGRRKTRALRGDTEISE